MQVVSALHRLPLNRHGPICLGLGILLHVEVATCTLMEKDRRLRIVFHGLGHVLGGFGEALGHDMIGGTI